MSGDTESYKTQELILKRQWICSLDLKTFYKKLWNNHVLL